MPAIETVSRDPASDKSLECAPELEADSVVSGDSDLLGRGSYMGIPIVGPRQLLERHGAAPGE
jgi:predicted nucleic acid-binding protein